MSWSRVGQRTSARQRGAASYQPSDRDQVRRQCTAEQAIISAHGSPTPPQRPVNRSPSVVVRSPVVGRIPRTDVDTDAGGMDVDPPDRRGHPHPVRRRGRVGLARPAEPHSRGGGRRHAATWRPRRSAGPISVSPTKSRSDNENHLASLFIDLRPLLITLRYPGAERRASY